VNDSIVVRVIDDGAPGGPAVVSMQIVPVPVNLLYRRRERERVASRQLAHLPLGSR
jgi:hypothetical protein